MTGYEGLRTASAYIDLSARGKIRATGGDRARLLHAMSTNDVAHLEENRGLYAFFLSAQGRVLADAHIYNRPDSLWLDTEPELAESLFAHLDKYIIADDVELEDLTERWACIALEGPSSVDAAAIIGLPSPNSAYEIRSYGDGFVVRTAFAAADGLRVFMPIDAGGSLKQKLRDHSVPEATPEEVRAVRIENKRPRYGEDISDRYLAHETQQLHAVHFNKGCYLGQEIVERVRSRGQVHRFLTPIRIAAQEAPQAGTKLTSDGKEVGEITSAAFSPALGEVVGFAYLRGAGLDSKSAMEVSVGSVTKQASIRL